MKDQNVCGSPPHRSAGFRPASPDGAAWKPALFTRFAALALTLLVATTPAASATLAAAVDTADRTPAPKPLFRDPVFDGAADPVVVWNPHVRAWWMFYTNRRANVAGLSGVSWVHGTPIGIAESRDGGTTWTYVGTAEIELPAEIAGTEPTFWAPEVIPAAQAACHVLRDTPASAAHEDVPEHCYVIRKNASGTDAARSESIVRTHHLFLTVVPGVFENWNHPRRIVHLTSTDLRKWTYRSTLALSSDRVIDAGVHRLPDGTWRLWYNDERDHKSIYHADSPDLFTWTDRGKCRGVGERPGEGPVVFHWRGFYWMLVDVWRGLGVYRSDDLENWTAQPDNLLAQPGRGADDGVFGGHPGVVVNGDRAWVFYFTHPGRTLEALAAKLDTSEQRRSSIQVVELREHDGVLSCDRDAPTYVDLREPAAATLPN